MTTEELAAAVVKVHELRPGTRYLLCLDANAVSRTLSSQLAWALKKHWTIDVLILMVQGRPADVLTIHDLGGTA